MNSHEIVLKRNIFYFNLMRSQMLLFVLLVLGIVLNLYFIDEISTNYRKPVYFMADDYGNLIENYSRNRPLYSDQDVCAWATNSLKEIYELDFVNFEKKIKDASKNFNELGFSKYVKALKESRNVKAIIDKKYVTRLTTIEPLKVVAKGVGNSGAIKDVYRWVLKGKFKAYYMNDKNFITPFVQDVDVTVLVIRESFYLYDKGISIALIIAK